MGTILKYIFYVALILVIYLVARGIYEGRITEDTTVKEVGSNIAAGIGLFFGQNDIAAGGFFESFGVKVVMGIVGKRTTAFVIFAAFAFVFEIFDNHLFFFFSHNNLVKKLKPDLLYPALKLLRLYEI